MKRKAPSSSSSSSLVHERFLLYDMLPEMLHEMARHLDPCSVECFRITCKKLHALIPVSPLETRNKSDYPSREHVVLATAALRFAVQALKKSKNTKPWDNGREMLYYYGQNLNFQQWMEMTKHIPAVLRRPGCEWHLPLVCGIIYSRNDTLLNPEIVVKLCSKRTYHKACMRQVLARPDVFEFITSQRLAGIHLWNQFDFSSLKLLKDNRFPLEPAHFDQKVARGYFELMTKDPILRDTLKKHLLMFPCSLGEFNDYKSAKLCCLILEQLRALFNFQGTFNGTPYDLMHKCLDEWDAVTLKQCLALGFWKTHLARTGGAGFLGMDTSFLRFNSNHITLKDPDPDCFEATWNVLVEHQLLRFDDLDKENYFSYVIDAQENWPLPVMARFKQLLNRYSKNVPGAAYMFQVLEAVESIPDAPPGRL